MSELIINYGPSKGKKILNIVIGIYIGIFCLYFCITEGVANRFGAPLFICSLIGFVMTAILVLNNTLWLPAPIAKMDTDIIETNIPKQNNMKIDWATVSKVNVGVSYIIFFVNGGQKQQKVDLSSFLYKDIKDIKSKVIELCEYKNIPYQND